MATIKLITKGVKNPSTLYIRFVNGRKTDIITSTSLQVNPAHWDNKKSNYKNVSVINNLVKKQAGVDKLKAFILEAYNDSYIAGDVIDREWLKQSLSAFFHRPKKEQNGYIHKNFVYFSSFCDYWLTNKSSTWKTGKNKYLSGKMKNQYESFVSIWKQFENNQAYKIAHIDNDLLENFVDYMTANQYAHSTTKRNLSRAKFFLARAEAEGVKVNPKFRERVFIEESDAPVTDPYLTVDEINSVYKLDLSHDMYLDNVRDNFVIGLWTGLRVSDFNKNLDLSNIHGDYIQIKTQKTSTWVTIPVHQQVRAILDKRFGNLPVKTSDRFFNEKIKTICMLAEIDDEVEGGVSKVDKHTKRKRKVYGRYKKYQLISSHVCRKSFATNLFGEIANHDLMKIAGWSSESMMLHYIKKTRSESAGNLKKYWESKL